MRVESSKGSKCCPPSIRSRPDNSRFREGLIVCGTMHHCRRSIARQRRMGGAVIPKANLSGRPLVPKTSAECRCSWFARYLAAPERTQTYLIRRLSFPNLSQVFQSQPSNQQGTSPARVAPFTLSGRISALANSEAWARVPKDGDRVLNWVSGHPGKPSWQSNTPLTRAMRVFEESEGNDLVPVSGQPTTHPFDTRSRPAEWRVAANHQIGSARIIQ